MNSAGKTVLIISPEAWGKYAVSKHHYAKELAHQGYEVYFLNPPGKKKQVAFLEESGIYLVDYKVFLKGLNLLPAFLRKWIARIDVFNINLLCGRKWDIVWSFDPYRFQDLRAFSRDARTIYYSADVHQTELDQEIVRSADLVIGPSVFCLEKFADHPNKHFINHGVARHFLTYTKSSQQPYTASKKPAFGYIGNLSMKFIDHQLLYDCIIQHPDVTFHLIGPIQSSNLAHTSDATITALMSGIAQLPNVIHLESIENSKLPAYINNLDGFIMCYDHRKWEKEASNSHKILELLSTGKVILTLPIYHYLDNPLLVTASQETFNRQFDDIIAHLKEYNSSEKQDARKAFAASNAYAQQLDKILSWLR